MRRMPSRLLRGALLGVVILGAGGIAWATTGGSNVVGPSTRIQPTGRQLEPVGRLTKLGNFPTGGALTPNGRVPGCLSTGRGIDDIRIVRDRGGRGFPGARFVNRQDRRRDWGSSLILFKEDDSQDGADQRPLGRIRCLVI